MAATIAFLILRVVLAWMFLYPLKTLLADWNATVNLTKIIVPFETQWAAVAMVAVMIGGSLSILFGIYAQIGALLLFIYSLMGVAVHYRLAGKLMEIKLSVLAMPNDKSTLEDAKALGVVGHVTSAQKNIVIAAALCMIIFLGSGPLSLTGTIF